LPAIIGMLGLESPRRRRPAPAFVVQPPVPQVAVHRGSGQQTGRCPHQSFRRLDPVLDQQLDGAAGGKVPVCLEACASRLREAAADGNEVVAAGSAAAS
jgi:hypothetical protein